MQVNTVLTNLAASTGGGRNVNSILDATFVCAPVGVNVDVVLSRYCGLPKGECVS